MAPVKLLLLCAVALWAVLALELGAASHICSGNCQTVTRGEGPLALAATAPLADFSVSTPFAPLDTDNAHCRHMQRAASLYPYQSACRVMRAALTEPVKNKRKYKTTKPVFWFPYKLEEFFTIDADNKFTLRFTKKKSFTYAVTCYYGWSDGSRNIFLDLWDANTFQYTQGGTVLCAFTIIEVPVTSACQAGGDRLWLDATVTSSAHMLLYSRPGGDKSYDAQGDAKLSAVMPRYDCPTMNTVRQKYRNLFQFKTL